MDELLKTFGQTIKAARQAAGLTQEELAEQVGITTRYIMAIENENRCLANTSFGHSFCFNYVISAV